MGVGALAAGSITCILNGHPDALIQLIDYGDGPTEYPWRGGDRDATIESINIRFSKKLFLSNNVALLIGLAVLARCIPIDSFRRWLRRRNQVFARIDDCDLVASIAGGDSFSDIYGMGRLFYVALPQVLVLLMGKTLVQLPQTYGPFRAGLAQAIARWILRRSSAVYARDEESLGVARNLAGRVEGQGTMAFCPDVGFVVRPKPPPGIDVDALCAPVPGTWLAGFNVSGLLHMGGYSGMNMFGLKENYPALVRAIIELLVRDLNATVLLVPHVFGAGAESEGDLAVCRDIVRELRPTYGDRLRTVDALCDQHGIKYIIGRCEFLAGSRMHACIAALSQTIPAVGLAYSGKFDGVFRSVGAESLVVDLRTADQSHVLATLGDVARNRAEWQEKLRARMPSVVDALLEVFRGRRVS
jgi:polysaccharide pyruvyl transferase WcaK-like protein